MKFLRTILLNNIIIKIIALVLALLTWSYIGGQMYVESINREKEALSIIEVSGEKLIARRLPIYANIEGEPAAGYKIRLDSIAVSPSYSVVAGPPEVFKEFSYIITKPVIVRNASNTVREYVELTPIPGCKIGYEGTVKVSVPIIKIKYR